jgi:hypothetical protein
MGEIEFERKFLSDFLLNLVLEEPDCLISFPFFQKFELKEGVF